LVSHNAPIAKLVLSINGLLVVWLFIFPNYLLNYCIKVFGGWFENGWGWGFQIGSLKWLLRPPWMVEVQKCIVTGV